MLSKEEREAITYARQEVESVLEKSKTGTKKANRTAGVLFALEEFFEYDDAGNCIGINDITVNEYLSRKYLNLAKKNGT